jgi:hypothetical protein
MAGFFLCSTQKIIKGYLSVTSFFFKIHWNKAMSIWLCSDISMSIDVQNQADNEQGYSLSLLEISVSLGSK